MGRSIHGESIGACLVINRGGRDMISRIVTFGSLCLVGAIAFVGAPAQADDIHSSAVICHNYNGFEAEDIDYTQAAVWNVSAAPRGIICSVPRSPVAPNSLAGFYVDGLNDPDARTECTLYVFHYDGTLAASRAFVNGAATWSEIVSFPANSIGQWDYVSVYCKLPPLLTGGLLGVTALRSYVPIQ
jgi:hypothetical protein